MLIDCSYFTEGPRHILNATPPDKPSGRIPNTDSQAVNLTINGYIRAYQKPFLIAVLGTSPALDMEGYLKNLEHNGDDVKEKGYEAVAELLREPFANYVFFKILRDANAQSTVKGIVQLKCANSYVSPIRRQVSVWNEMVDMLKSFSQWSSTTDCTVKGIAVSANFLTKINCLNL